VFRVVAKVPLASMWLLAHFMANVVAKVFKIVAWVLLRCSGWLPGCCYVYVVSKPMYTSE